MMKKLHIIFTLQLLISANAFSQGFDDKALQAQVQEAIKKAYPASVFLADYDPVTKTINGQSFSGVVVSPDGIILTAAHVGSPNKTFLVHFPDGKECTATGLGRIGLYDAAILKIYEKGTWPYAEIGWSSTLQVYEPCLCIAYPGTFSPKRLPVVRFGYVAEPLTLRNMIRTTCLMEPGDSGGR